MALAGERSRRSVGEAAAVGLLALSDRAQYVWVEQGRPDVALNPGGTIPVEELNASNDE
jgi:hypothetical protein